MTVSFAAATYTAAESGTSRAVLIAVTLSADPERDVRIPITTTLQGNASMDDFAVVEEVIIRDGETEASILFSATQDTDEDHGESVRLGFGTDLPAGITASGTTTVTIIDDDPAVTVEFRGGHVRGCRGWHSAGDCGAERNPAPPAGHSRNLHKPGRRRRYCRPQRLVTSMCP